jgi:hypothetical protein
MDAYPHSADIIMRAIIDTEYLIDVRYLDLRISYPPAIRAAYMEIANNAIDVALEHWCFDHQQDTIAITAVQREAIADILIECAWAEIERLAAEDAEARADEMDGADFDRFGNSIPYPQPYNMGGTYAVVNTISSEITIPGLQAANLIEILYGVRNAIPDEERVAKFMIEYIINYLGMIAMAAGDVSADIPTTPEELVEAWRAA